MKSNHFQNMAEEERICGLLSLVLAILCSNPVQVFSHTCSHTVPKPDQVVYNVPLNEPSHVIKKRSPDQRLRIYIEYDDSVRKLHTNQRRLIKDDLIPTAVEFWENTLKIRHTHGPIRLLRQCNTDHVRYKDGNPYPYCVNGCLEETMCGETRVPAHHLEACRVAFDGEDYRIQGYSGSGIDDADFILYVSAYYTERCKVGTTVAYAAYCQLEGTLDRPIAGYVNLCPHAVSTQPHDIHQMHSTIKHEILHALGFSAGLYAFYRDENGEPLTQRYRGTSRPPFNETLQLYQWSDKVVKQVTRKDWKFKNGKADRTVNILVTPNVKEEVRRHFNCSSLEGAELEDQGVLGTALTHWEKRIYENEVMTGTYTQNPTVSRITLALMEDTGWYKVNYDMAEPLTWGRNLGCDFVNKSCLEWMEMKRAENQHIHPFCERVKGGGLETECTEGRDAVALCNLVEYPDELPEMYQHFHSIPGVDQSKVTKYAGSVVLADYCPYIQEFNWKKNGVVVRGSKCELFQNNADAENNYMLEHYSNESKCFDHHRPWSLRHCQVTHTVEHWGSGCYKVSSLLARTPDSGDTGHDITPEEDGCSDITRGLRPLVISLHPIAGGCDIMFKCSNTTGLTVSVEGKTYRCYRTGQLLSVSVVTSNWLHEGNIVCPSCDLVCQDRGVVCPPEIEPPLPFNEELIQPPCSLANKLVAVVTLHISLIVYSLKIMLTSYL